MAEFTSNARRFRSREIFRPASGWLIGPIVRQLPKQSLESTLDSTRKAVLSRRGAGAGNGRIPAAANKVE